MSCSTCDKITKNDKPPSEYEKAEKLAKLQADAEQRIYVVVENEGVYYPECLECRNKSEIKYGNVVAYIR
jgi:hypothetical protein